MHKYDFWKRCLLWPVVRVCVFVYVKYVYVFATLTWPIGYFPPPSCGLTSCFIADGIPPDGSNILLVHNSTCTRCVTDPQGGRREGDRRGRLVGMRGGEKKEINGGIRDGFPCLMYVSLFLPVYIPCIPLGIMDDYYLEH